MPKFKFKSARKNKFHFIKDDEDIFQNNMLKGSHIEIFSSKKIIIEGCTNIFDYQDDYIKLKLKKSYINIFGANFIITSFADDKIEINGSILSIEFGV